MRSSERVDAADALLDRRIFTLSETDWENLVERLDDPPSPNAELKVLLARTPTWEQVG